MNDDIDPNALYDAFMRRPDGSTAQQFAVLPGSSVQAMYDRLGNLCDERYAFTKVA